MTTTEHHIAWFRHTGPYIKAHRGRTFVVYLGNGALESAGLVTLVHDLALLHSLGVRRVLVHATRTAIDAALCAEQSAQFHAGIRITDNATLAIASETAARKRRPGLDIVFVVSCVPRTHSCAADMCVVHQHKARAHAA